MNGHVDGLGDRAGDERLRRRHHADVALDREIALARASARIGAVEHRIVLGSQMRRALDRHRAADVDVGRLDLALAEADVREQVEGGRGDRLGRDAERLTQKLLAERPFVEHELDVEGGGQRLVDLLDDLRREPLGGKRRMVDRRRVRMVDRRRVRQRAVADRIGLDLGDLGLAVAEHAQSFRHRAVDDLEIAAARELLEFHQGEIRLDPGGVAVHHQADRAGRRDHTRLRVAIAVGLAEGQRLVPGDFRVLDQRRVRTMGVVEPHRRGRELLVAGLGAVGRAPMVADDAQHVLAVLPVSRERAELGRHLGRGRVGNPGHDRGHRPADRAAGLAVIGNARRHQ